MNLLYVYIHINALFIRVYLTDVAVFYYKRCSNLWVVQILKRVWTVYKFWKNTQRLYDFVQDQITRKDGINYLLDCSCSRRDNFSAGVDSNK